MVGVAAPGPQDGAQAAQGPLQLELVEPSDTAYEQKVMVTNKTGCAASVFDFTTVAARRAKHWAPPSPPHLERDTSSHCGRRYRRPQRRALALMVHGEWPGKGDTLAGGGWTEDEPEVAGAAASPSGVAGTDASGLEVTPRPGTGRVETPAAFVATEIAAPKAADSTGRSAPTGDATVYGPRSDRRGAATRNNRRRPPAHRRRSRARRRGRGRCP